MNVLGVQLKTINLENQKNEIDLSDFVAGIYFIKTETNCIKIIKQ